MGKASKWFRSLLGSKKSPESSPAKENKRKSRWALPNSGDNSAGDPPASPYVDGIDANKHAIAVAAATAAVAEAALAAAHAAAEVVRLTSGGRSGRGDRRLVVAAAAVKIQSAFRAYLARRALRALKGLVKLQALVRGHIVRKQSADMLRRMQAMARIQARASAHRSFMPDSSNAKTKFSNSHHPGVTNVRKYEERLNSAKNGGSLYKPNHSRSNFGNNVNKESSQIASRWLNHWMEQCAWESLHEPSRGDDERSAKILEIDTWKPNQNTARNDRTAPTPQYFSAWNETCPASRLSSKLQKPNPSVSSEDVSSIGGDQQVSARTVDNSPRVQSKGAFTPARSECSGSLFGDYLGHHPSYMANTESSRAKLRSHSAPKQRMELEGLGLSSTYNGRDFWESDTVSERGSFFPAGHRGNVYRQVKRQETPTRDYGRRI